MCHRGRWRPGAADTLARSDDERSFRKDGGEVRSAVEWAQVGAMAAEGVSQRETAARLGSTGERSGGWWRLRSARRRSRSEVR